MSNRGNQPLVSQQQGSQNQASQSSSQKKPPEYKLKNATMEVIGWVTEPHMKMRLKFTLRGGVEKVISKFQHVKI